MNRWLAVAPLAVFAVAVAGTSALRADDPVPPEIQALMDKIREGKPLTPYEQHQLNAYGLRHRDAPVDGMTLDDVLAIVHSARVLGRDIPEGDKAKIRAWGEGMKARQKQLEKDAQDMERLSGTAGGPKREAPPDLHEGAVRVRISQHIVHDDKGKDYHGHADQTVDFDVTFPVRFTVQDEGENGLFRLSWAPSALKKTVKGTFSSRFESSDGGSTHTVTSGFAVDESVLTGSMTTGEVAVPHGGPRPYVQVMVCSTAQGNGRSHVHQNDPPSDTDSDIKVLALPAAGVADDGILEEAPLKSTKLPPTTSPELRRLVLEKTPVESKLPAEKAQSTFDVADFRAKWKKSQPFAAPVHYGYSYDLEENHDGASKSLQVTSSTTFELQLGPRSDVVLEIEPVSKDAYDKWVPKLFTLDPAEAKVFGVAVADDSVTLPIRVSFRRAGSVAAPKAGSGPSASGSVDAPDDRKGMIELHWESLSQNRGICINYPVTNAVARPGLFFPQKSASCAQDDNLKIDSEGKSASTIKPVSSIVVKVAARDTGAWGKLVAKWTDSDGGSEVLAVYEPTGTHSLDIPKDEDKNHIADGWHDGAKGKEEHSDEENEPTGSAKGDGLDLYDEYRGMVLTDSDSGKQSFRRFEPLGKRKLFLCVNKSRCPDRPLVLKGVANFQKMVPLDVVYFEINDFNDDGLKPGFPSRMNPNSESSLKAYGTWVNNEPPPAVKEGEDPPQLRTWGTDDTTGARVPGDVTRVSIFRDNVAQFFTNNLNNGMSFEKTPWRANYLARRGVSCDAYLAKFRELVPHNTEAFIVSSISHELLHLTGRGHHGPEASDGARSCPMRYWANHISDPVFNVSLMYGKWDPSVDSLDPPEEPTTPFDPTAALLPWAPHVAWEVCAECKAKLHLTK